MAKLALTVLAIHTGEDKKDEVTRSQLSIVRVLLETQNTAPIFFKPRNMIVYAREWRRDNPYVSLDDNCSFLFKML